MDKLIVVREAFNLFFGGSDDEDNENNGNVKIVKNENYAEDVVPRFSDQTFKQHFRLSRHVFEILCSEIHALEEHRYGPGRNSTIIEKQLMITLWYLGNPECMRYVHKDLFFVNPY